MESEPGPLVAAGLEWRDRDRGRLERWLAALGFAVSRTGGQPVLRFSPLTVSLLGGGTNDEGFRFAAPEAGGSDVERVRHPNGLECAVAVAIASTDGERTMRQLGAAVPAEVVSDESLAGRGWLAASGGIDVVVLEPSTEGRLAAALARFGEGPVALYLAGPAAVGDKLTDVLEPPAPWPGGHAARLVRPLRRWGPFLLVVDCD